MESSDRTQLGTPEDFDLFIADIGETTSDCDSDDDVKARTNLLIVTRPTLDLKETLTRITQKETRQVMVFEREREI